MEYSYAPLEDADSVRLLQLRPGYGSAPLEAHLAIYRLEEQCSYDALSYVWGEPNLTEVLYVGDQALGIAKNLHAILLQLRLPDEVCILWIDAVCINQQDSIEKGQQVALMGQIYQQANTVLCWLGPLSTHRLWALRFLQKLAEEARLYAKLNDVGPFWTVTVRDDILLPGADIELIIESALEAHVEAIYESDWFTRLWVVQELTLANNPRILCGDFGLSWVEFELATRILMGSLMKASLPPKVLLSIQDGWHLARLRAKHSLNMRPITAPQICYEIDQKWAIGNVAWEMRHKKCTDDRDRVYALLSVAASGNGLKLFVPEPFYPDYTRPVEWVYYQYWVRYGGCTSLFYAGLSRRRGYSDMDAVQVTNQDVSRLFNDDYLPSWAPDLRPHVTKEWKPIFTLDYCTSTPLQYQARQLTSGPKILMIRGHRFDVVARVFRAHQSTKPDQHHEDLVNLRGIIISLLSLESKYAPYPSGQEWVEALGSTLMMEEPYNHDHPFQRYLAAANIKLRLSDSDLRRIWRLYVDLFLTENGATWKKYRSIVSSIANPRRRFRVSSTMGLDADGGLVWMLHKYLGDVLQAHCFIITERGYMGLAPPDTMIGDVVVALGGPNVPFIVRDVLGLAVGNLTADDAQCSVTSGGSKSNVSQLMGPCYLQGIMKAEFLEEERYQKEFEWGNYNIKDCMWKRPKPTLHLI